MRRRYFIQLAAAAAAGAMVKHSSPTAELRISQAATGPGVVVTATASVTKAIASVPREHWLGVSGWISADDVIHVMLEKRPEDPWSHPEMVFPQLQPGRRYRLRMMNATASTIPVHLPGHRVELAHYSVFEADLLS